MKPMPAGSGRNVLQTRMTESANGMPRSIYMDWSRTDHGGIPQDRHHSLKKLKLDADATDADVEAHKFTRNSYCMFA